MNPPPKKPLWMWMALIIAISFVFASVQEGMHWFDDGSSESRGRFQENFWTTVGVCCLAILIGKAGKFIVFLGQPRKNDPKESFQPDGMPRFQFSLARLLLATAIVAMVFGLSRSLFGPKVPMAFYLSPIVVAMGFGGLALLAKKSDIPRIAWSASLGTLGAFAGFILAPPIHPPYEAGDEFRYGIVTAIIGWGIGCFLYRKEERRK